MKHHGYNLKLFVQDGKVKIDDLASAFGVTRQTISLYYGKERFVSKDIEALENWVARTDIKKHITFHSARHTFCTLLMKRKVDYKTIISAMGWDEKSGMEHILRYAHLVDENVKDAVGQLDSILL